MKNHYHPTISRISRTSGTKLFSAILLKMIALVVVIGIIVRGILIATSGPSTLDMTLGQYLLAFLFGAINDGLVAIIGFAPLGLFILSIGNGKFNRPWGVILLALLTATMIWVGWFSPALQEFNRGLAKVLRWIMIYWIAVFALRMIFPALRKGWTLFWLSTILFIYTTILILNAAGEFFFWDEFGVRYNFIAVDYLVYTSEVIGNILESYPIVPLAAILIVVSVIVTWILFRKQIAESNQFYDGKWRMKCLLLYVIGASVSFGGLMLMPRFQQSDNTYYNELQANGACRFVEAFMKNEIDYRQFYLSIPDDEAESIIHDIYGSNENNARHIAADSTERHPNIVLITMESMSASFLKRFGSDEGLTPNLDSLYRQSIAFDRMYANGNRTVRGLEALSLSLPPSAGQSLIKRPELKDRPNIGGVLRDKGYRTMFFYGGKSYFDNMGPYFKSIGFDIIDIDNYKPDEITFSNVWGVCDGDSYSKMLRELDATYASGKPFFAQIMTISNHRPYTYPDGCIDIPNDSKSRAGGVKYADYALGRFMAEAARKPWFDNTVFVIIADHCASSAGETKLPPHNYHIPAMIYSPKLLSPQTIDYITSQIDIMPTLLNLLGIGYDSTFYGQNALDPSYNPRAFLATYQDLGYLEGDTLTVLSPGKKVEQFRIESTDTGEELIKIEKNDSLLTRKVVALYQTSATWNN